MIFVLGPHNLESAIKICKIPLAQSAKRVACLTLFGLAVCRKRKVRRLGILARRAIECCTVLLAARHAELRQDSCKDRRRQFAIINQQPAAKSGMVGGGMTNPGQHTRKVFVALLFPNPKRQQAAGFRFIFEHVTGLAQQIGDVDCGQRVGALGDDQVASLEAGQHFAHPQRRQRAFQTAQIHGLFGQKLGSCRPPR
jgi:hypothetical protein